MLWISVAGRFFHLATAQGHASAESSLQFAVAMKGRGAVVERETLLTSFYLGHKLASKNVKSCSSWLELAAHEVRVVPCKV